MGVTSTTRSGLRKHQLVPSWLATAVGLVHRGPPQFLLPGRPLWSRGRGYRVCRDSVRASRFRSFDQGWSSTCASGHRRTRTPARSHLSTSALLSVLSAIFPHLGHKSRAAETPTCAGLHRRVQMLVKRSRGPAWPAHDCMRQTQTPHAEATWACAGETTTCARPEEVLTTNHDLNGIEHTSSDASFAYLRRWRWLPRCCRRLEQPPVAEAPEHCRASARVACADRVLASLIRHRRSRRSHCCAERLDRDLRVVDGPYLNGVCGRSARRSGAEGHPTSAARSTPRCLRSSRSPQLLAQLI